MRHVINFFITGFIVWIFQLIGWVQIHSEIAPFANTLANQVLVSGIIGLIFTVGLWLAGQAYLTFIVATIGFGCLLFPIYLAFIGPIGFWVVMKILPGWVTPNANVWQIILMGVIISWVRIPSTSSKQKT